MRKKARFSLVKTVLIALMVLPISMLIRFLIRDRVIDTHRFFGLSVNLDREPEQSVVMVNDLGVKTLLIRMPLWEMHRLEEYETFCSHFSDKEITINIMQDREHIEGLEALKKDLFQIFDALGKYASRFQVGTTINRAKWGFFGVDEYLKFYKVAQKVRDKDFIDLELIGPSVIDFEFHFTAHALFNMHKVYFDGLSSLLYVDRRGAPEHTQMGFSLFEKIRLQRAMMMLSAQVGKKFYITETNWPISNTAPYAPTSEHECVSEEDYALFMLRYYLLAFASQQVDTVFWHQLIASGYGMIDSREGIRKRLAYKVFKTMIEQLEGAEFHSYGVYDERDGTYISYGVFEDRHMLTCKNHLGNLSILWSEHEHIIHFAKPHLVVCFEGSRRVCSEVKINSKPIYIYPEGEL
ncbi:MAG: glycosyl hydrolase [Campylobacterota bacterium]|nr:glycosyl hydrolase [Campylobacterota bacterium]